MDCVGRSKAGEEGLHSSYFPDLVKGANGGRCRLRSTLSTFALILNLPLLPAVMAIEKHSTSVLDNDNIQVCSAFKKIKGQCLLIRPSETLKVLPQGMPSPRGRARLWKAT